MLKVPTAETFMGPGGQPGAQLSTPGALNTLQEVGAATTRLEHGLTAATSEAAREISLTQIQDNEAKAKEHDAKVMGVLQGALYDPDTGYLAKKGRDAVDARPDTVVKLTEAIGTLGNDLTPQQQKLAAAATQMRVQAAITQINQHAIGQHQVYEQAAGKVRLQASTDGAALSYGSTDKPTIEFNHEAPGANSPYQQYLATIESETRSQAALNGIRDEKIVGALVRDNLATAYAATLEHMLGGAKGAKGLTPGDRAVAQAYFDKVQGSLTAKQIDILKPQLQASGEQDAALNLSIDISNTIPLYADQVKELDRQFKAGKITSDVHKLAKQELLQANTARRAEESEKDKAVLGDIWAMAKKGQSLANVSPATLAYIKQRGLGTNVDAIFKRNEPGGEAFDDSKLYNDLMRMSAEDAANFTRTDLAKLSGQLTKGHWDHLVNVQTSISRQDVRGMEINKVMHNAISDARTNMLAAGIDLTPKPGSEAAKKKEAFEATLRDSIIAAQQAKGDKPLTPDEAKKITTGLLKEQALSGTWWDTNKRVYTMTPEERAGKWTIPKEERKTIVDSLKRSNMLPSEENIQRAYKLKQGLQ